MPHKHLAGWCNNAFNYVDQDIDPFSFTYKKERN